MQTLIRSAAVALATAAAVCALPIESARAQVPGADELEEVVVTGSRIRRDPLNEPPRSWSSAPRI